MDASAIKELQNSQAIGAAVSAFSSGNNAIALPDGWKTVDLEEFQDNRRRARGAMTTHTIESFASYVDQHAEDGSTVFVDDEKMQTVAVLNLGTPEVPGHADNTAIYSPIKTAAFKALQAVTNGAALTQKVVAEFLEDWRDNILCFDDNTTITLSAAIAAIRNVSIEALRKVESSVAQLAETKTAFESVSASSKTAIPTIIYFKCVPYAGFENRTFIVRLGILTGESTPRISLRIVKPEEAQEEMTTELVGKVTKAIGKTSIVAIGSYSKRT